MGAIERALQTLGLGPDATPQDIKQAYRDLAMVWHPDRFPRDSRVQRKAEEHLKEINKAYEVLRGYDPASRIHSDPWTRPHPGYDHFGVGAPKQSSTALTLRSLVPLWTYIIGTMSRGLPLLWAHITNTMYKSLVPLRARITGTMCSGRVPLRGYIIGAILVICLVGYLVETSMTSHRPGRSTPGNSPGIGAQEQQSLPVSVRPETREPAGPPTRLPPDGENRGEYSSREGAPEQGVGPSPASEPDQRSALNGVIPAPGAISRGTFTVGSTKDEVLAVQGKPTEQSDRAWTYGSSLVLFGGDRVAGWDVRPGSPLKVRMLPSRPARRTTKDYFRVGSTKDEVLAVQGTPTEFRDRVWHYGSSSVLFSGDRVRSWYVEPDSPLKVRPQ